MTIITFFNITGLYLKNNYESNYDSDKFYRVILSNDHNKHTESLLKNRNTKS